MPINTANVLSLNHMDSFNMFNNPSANQLTFGYGQQFPPARIPLPSPNLQAAPLFVNTNSQRDNHSVQSFTNELVHRKSKDSDNTNLISLSSPNDDLNYLKVILNYAVFHK